MCATDFFGATDFFLRATMSDSELPQRFKIASSSAHGVDSAVRHRGIEQRLTGGAQDGHVARSGRARRRRATFVPAPPQASPSLAPAGCRTPPMWNTSCSRSRSKPDPLRWFQSVHPSRGQCSQSVMRSLCTPSDDIRDRWFRFTISSQGRAERSLGS